MQACILYVVSASLTRVYIQTCIVLLAGQFFDEDYKQMLAKCLKNVVFDHLHKISRLSSKNAFPTLGVKIGHKPLSKHIPLRSQNE